MAKELEACRSCGGRLLKTVLDLGALYPSGFLRPEEKLSEDQKVPLALCECGDCGLVQLKHTVELDNMYRQYWYMSSLNKSMVSSLQNIVDDIINKIELEKGDTVLDIGCNDGTMLGMYPKHVSVVGFDPALNLTKPPFGIFVNDYFSAERFKLIGAEIGSDDYSQAIRRPKVITAIAMFYDLPDPNKFLEDVYEVMHDDGIFVVQFTDLLSMFKVCAFDNICHEHLEYYKLADVITLLYANGFSVMDVSYNDVNGGSVRVTSCKEGRYDMNPRVLDHLIEEQRYFATHTFEDFASCILETKDKLQELLEQTLDGKKIFVLGASTKGNTLLQVCDVYSPIVPYAAEVNSDKWGLRTVGTDIQIISEAEAMEMKPDYLLVLPWHFKDSLLTKKNVKDYLEQGGKLVFPLPKFTIIGKEND